MPHDIRIVFHGEAWAFPGEIDVQEIPSAFRGRRLCGHSLFRLRSIPSSPRLAK